MKKAIVVASCVAALAAFTTLGASAQTTGPAGQDTTQKDNMTNGGMNKGDAGSMGMSSGKMSSKGKAKKAGMSKGKSKTGEKAGDQSGDE